MSASEFLPTASWANLQLRAQTLRRLRAFFDARGFVEVETPLLSHDTVVDRHLDPIPVTLFADPREPSRGELLFLQTSPEFGMKRLLAAGEATAIYQITRAFRGAEQGSQHNPEFTILEWYRVGDGYEQGMNLLAELAAELFSVLEVDRVTYHEAFRRWAEIDVADFAAGRDAAELDLLMVSRIQPELGRDHPTILYDYPADQAALAQTTERAERMVAERFELFFRGVELANGYHELLDADVLRARNRRNNALRQADGKYSLPETSRLLSAMEHGLPPCAGCALGIDRLVMLLACAAEISQVIAFPIDRA
jgi:lysyl-tRNA synthetase class 2